MTSRAGFVICVSTPPMPPGVSSVAASIARARAQEKGFRLDKAMWTAKQSSSGFSVCFKASGAFILKDLPNSRKTKPNEE